jgi:hypothetical protein
MPMLQDGSPVYVDTLTKQKTINYDEELLVILSSVLSHFNKTYHLQIPVNQLFITYKGRDLENLMKRGTVILKQIKYKYFSDKLLKLWDLLYVYLLRQDKIKSKNITKKSF